MDAGVVDVRDGQRDDVGGGDDVPVLPALVAPACVQTAADPVGVVQLAAGPADRLGVEASVWAAQCHGLGQLAFGHGYLLLGSGSDELFVHGVYPLPWLR